MNTRLQRRFFLSFWAAVVLILLSCVGLKLALDLRLLGRRGADHAHVLVLLILCAVCMSGLA